MSVEIDPNMPGLTEASAKLDALIAAEAAGDPTAAPPEAGSSAMPASDPARDHATDAAAPTPDSDSKTDAPAAAETPAAPEQPQAKSDEKTERKPTEPEKSRYAKSQERLTKTWDAVNSEKAALQAERTKHEAERAQLARERAEFAAIQKRAEQPQYSPEDYQRAAAGKRSVAEQLKLQAERVENEGDFTKAEQLRKQAQRHEAAADDLADYAEKLAKNPPPGFAERKTQLEQSKRTWTMEAGREFPDLMKDNSPLQRRAAEHLAAVANRDPDFAALPSVNYHVARLAAAELQAKEWEAAAAGVPALQKELGELKAKVKELQAFTTPGGSPAIPRLGATTPQQDEEAELERMAREMVTFR